jgi:hypothetical protein
MRKPEISLDIANHADGCDNETIAAAEQQLGSNFPPSYRLVIEQLGTFDIAGEEILGIYQTPAMGSALLGSTIETLEARSRYGMSSHLLVVMYDGMGGSIVLDSSQSDNEGEYPVLVWDPGHTTRESMERLSPDFGHYALDLCQRAVTSWRQST